LTRKRSRAVLRRAVGNVPVKATRWPPILRPARFGAGERLQGPTYRYTTTTWVSPRWSLLSMWPCAEIRTRGLHEWGHSRATPDLKARQHPGSPARHSSTPGHATCTALDMPGAPPTAGRQRPDRQYYAANPCGIRIHPRSHLDAFALWPRIDAHQERETNGRLEFFAQRFTIPETVLTLLCIQGHDPIDIAQRSSAGQTVLDGHPCAPIAEPLTR